MFDMKRTLNWVSRHDERSRDYPVQQILPAHPRIKPRMWAEGVVLDQGREGACVGFGWTAALLASPERPAPQPDVEVAEAFAKDVYHEAQKIDEWPGEDYEGTSVLAGAKTLARRNLIDSYRWAFGLNDVRDTVIWKGPVVIGIPWFEGMYDTDNHGVVDVSGDMVGGHCITLTGYHPYARLGGKVREVFRWRNSWGTGYGRNGSGYIEAADLAWLLNMRGEACIPIGKRFEYVPQKNEAEIIEQLETGEDVL